MCDAKLKGSCIACGKYNVNIVKLTCGPNVERVWGYCEECNES